MASNKEIKALLLRHLDNCEQTLHDTVKEKCDEYKEAIETTHNNLPLLINENKWAALRLKGEDIQTSSNWIDILSDCEFDFEEYKKLGENDGSLQILYSLFEKLGMKDEAKKALSLIYTE